MASLRDYERKRDQKKTPEPFGRRTKRAKSPIFVVQRHDARRLHYDFRLERDGVLLSWAVPKGVPLETGQRNLAVHVENSDIAGLSFFYIELSHSCSPFGFNVLGDLLRLLKAIEGICFRVVSVKHRQEFRNR